ncbi:MAG: hypothetical protein IJG43_09640 [Acidaminococcaceae bacterium]|nr:hypothetical protein [Acidaminococcaceae bacterium]
MELIYATEKIRRLCHSTSVAIKFFGGRKELAISLAARINALQNAINIKDIVVQKPFHFHQLNNKNGKDFNGYFAIDVKSRSDPWRIILRPLDSNKNPFVPCHIDEIADYVEVVEIREVSKHYE